MRLIYASGLLLWLSAPLVLNADATIRYKTDFKATTTLPTVVANDPRAQKQLFPTISLFQMKGDKEYSHVGSIDSLRDFSKQEITVIDTANRVFSTVFMKDYMSAMSDAIPQMPPMPPMQKAMLQTFFQKMKTTFAARKTGRTGSVLGVQATESEWTLTLELPADGLPLPPGSLPPGQPLGLIKVVMQVWPAAPDEIARIPALSEFVSRDASASPFLDDPNTALLRGLANFPGIRDGLAPMFDEFSKSKSPVLKSHFEIYLPVLAQIAALPSAKSPLLPAGLDPNAPVAEINVEAIEISAASIDDSVFQVPAGYHAINLGDLLKNMRSPSAPIPPVASLPANP